MVSFVVNWIESWGVYVWEDYLDWDDENWMKYILVWIDEKGEVVIDY